MDYYRAIYFDPKPDITAYELARVLCFAFEYGRERTKLFPIKARTENDWALVRAILQQQYPEAVRHLHGVSGQVKHDSGNGEGI